MIYITNKQQVKRRGKMGDANAGEGTICSGCYSVFKGNSSRRLGFSPSSYFSQAPRGGSLQLISYLNSSVFLLRQN